MSMGFEFSCAKNMSAQWMDTPQKLECYPKKPGDVHTKITTLQGTYSGSFESLQTASIKCFSSLSTSYQQLAWKSEKKNKDTRWARTSYKYIGRVITPLLTGGITRYLKLVVGPTLYLTFGKPDLFRCGGSKDRSD